MEDFIMICKQPKIMTIAGLLAILLFFIGIDCAISHMVDFAEPEVEELTENQQQRLALYSDMTGRLWNLATVVIGVSGLSYRRSERRGKYSGDGRWLLLATGLAALSLYAGYLTYDNLVWMLREQFFNLENILLQSFRLIQFWSFIGSVLMLSVYWLTEHQDGMDQSSHQGRRS